MPQEIYSFLQGFRFSHFSFFWNAFSSLIPPDYTETNHPESLVPDGNLLRQAGFSLTLQLFLLLFFGLALMVSYIVFCYKRLLEPPYIRRILRILIMLMSLCFMNEVFCSVCQVRYHHTQNPKYPGLYNGSFGGSIFLLVFIPLLMAGAFTHYYLTYFQDSE